MSLFKVIYYYYYFFLPLFSLLKSCYVQRSTAVPKAKKVERVTLEEFFSAGESDSEFSPDSESDWMETPVKRKISRAKVSRAKV